MTDQLQTSEETPVDAPPKRSTTEGPEPRNPRGLSRRQFLPRAAGAIATLGIGAAAGYEYREHHDALPNPYKNLSEEEKGASALTGPAPGTPGSGISRFVTRPDIHPPSVRVNELMPGMVAQDTPRFMALTPMLSVTYEGEQRGPMLIDRHGRLVWFQPLSNSVFDVNVQEYEGKPVLTWWQGDVVDGHGTGSVTVVDSSYRTIASLQSTSQRPLDLHEFNITARGTALLTSYRETTTDLSSVGGASSASVLAGHAMEVDLATGRVLLDWNSLDHVSVAESYMSIPGSSSSPYDYFHINSVSEAADGNLLISGRCTWCVYKVHRTTGRVIWRMNGKRSDFDVAPAARFQWQHHTRAHGGSAMTVFDNASTSGHGSRGLLLHVDERRRRVKVTHAYQHPAKFVTKTMGSVQLLPNEHVVVGWGQQPYFSEFGPEGALAADGQFDSASYSYRTFLVDWIGHPSEPPTLVATTNPNGGFVVYASWNGATQIDHWTVLAGGSPDSLSPVGSQPWSGFETAIIVNSNGPNFAVVAYDRHGKQLGRSEPV